MVAGELCTPAPHYRTRLCRNYGMGFEPRVSQGVGRGVHVSVHVRKQKGCEMAYSPFAPFPYFSA
jgi:hypothetical protein